MSDSHGHHNEKFHEDSNEVEEFATKFKVTWSRYGNLVTGVMLAASASWFGYNYWHTNHVNAIEADSRDLASDSPEVLASQSTKATDPRKGVLMALYGADLFLKKAQTEKKDDATEKALTHAKALYQQVIADPKADVLLKTNARLGLASVAESLHEWDAAKTAYDQVISTPNVLPNLAELAQIRKAELPAIEKPVVFGPEPVKVVEPVKESATEQGQDASVLTTTVPASLARPAGPVTPVKK